MSQSMFVGPYRIGRRSFLRLSALSTAVTVAGLTSLMMACTDLPDQTFPLEADHGKSEPPDLELNLVATASDVSILPGTLTKALTYRAELLHGDPDSVQMLPNSYLGPILRVQQGQKVRIHFINRLDEPSIVHWHGLIVPPEMDGHPQDVVGPNETYTYDFEVINRAGTYWFHPHPHGRTGAQTYHGLAGLFLVSDHEESALALPRGDQDIALVLQDRLFDNTNQFVYLRQDPADFPMGAQMQQVMGVLGDHILVNGHPDYVLPVATRAYRMRLLNGSNARIFKLAWSNGMPMTVIGTDGGLLQRPVTREYVTLAPSERVDLWVDLRDMDLGSELRLQSLSFTGVEAGPMNEMMHDMDALPNGAPFDVLTVKIDRLEQETLQMPETLATFTHLDAASAANAEQPRRFALFMDENMNWTINGRVFVADEIAEDETVALNSLEIWEFVNELVTFNDSSGMMDHGAMGHSMGGPQSDAMMADFMAHPIHLHGVQFQVLERHVAEEQREGWVSVRDGFVDEGWKDSVLVMPGERVRLLIHFANYPGQYLYHCHNLEHEDMGMMRNYSIVV